jgi:hypothetical protein
MTEDSSNSDNKKICIDCGKELKLYNIRKNRCQNCYKEYSKRPCITCNQHKKIVNQGMCDNCYYKIRPYKKCPKCNELHKESTILCQKCDKKKLQDRLPKKKCECDDPSCTEMIPIKTVSFEPMRFAKGHHMKCNGHWNYKNGICKREGKYTTRRINGVSKLDHRIVYEEYYQCCLLPWIEIHHINGKRDDNRIENLQPLTKKQHRILESTGRKYPNRKRRKVI